MTKRAQSEPKLAPAAVTLLMVIGLAESLLALYQWMELLTVRSGGAATCALSETVNCATVWNSSFASRLHAALGMPVAALGLVWGLTALGLSLWLAHRALAGAELKRLITAIRLTAAAGALSCISFAVGSFQAGAVCLTCLATFALVLAFALVAFRLLPGAFEVTWASLKPALTPLLAVLIPVYLAFLYPGTRTPRAQGTSLPSPVAGPTGTQPGASGGTVSATSPSSLSDDQRRVAEFLGQLPWAEQQAVADSLEIYRRAVAPDVSEFGVRERVGPAHAPMRIVEFTDIMCGHCAALMRTLKELKRAVPEGRISVEARYFPLDAECNPAMQHSDGSGTRCLGAKVQICLEGAPDFTELREKLFEHQASLTKEKVLELASSGSVKREQLLACVASPQTQQKLERDIAYALRYNLQGTPLVVINGKEGTPVGAFLYAMAMTGVNPHSPVFAKLPAARPPMAHDDHHHGHDHNHPH